MERHFRKYKVHSRFYKNINAEMVYMGFPEKCMDPLKREVELSGYSWIQVDENRQQQEQRFFCSLPKGLKLLPNLYIFALYKNSI